MKAAARRFHTLRVLETRAETSQARSVMFEIPAALREQFRWRPGQHITVRFNLDGEELRRSYSVSAAPAPGAPLRITVKRVPEGRVSNYINDELRAGAAAEVMPPFGGFVLQAQPRARRTYYMFAAGSGITPIFAMLNSVLQAEPYSVVLLAYGNADAKNILFHNALGELEAQSEGRLVVRHILSRPGWFGGGDCWMRGRIDAEGVGAFLEAHPPEAQDTRHYICGPGEMNSTVRRALMDLDVPAERIHQESYGGAVVRDTSFAGVAAQAKVRLAGRELTVPIAAGQSVLQAVRAAGGAPPYSCQSGVCGACRAQLQSGEVHLRAAMALSEAEIKSGAILTCQAVAKTPQLVLDYGE